MRYSLILSFLTISLPAYGSLLVDFDFTGVDPAAAMASGGTFGAVSLDSNLSLTAAMSAPSLQNGATFRPASSVVQTGAALDSALRDDVVAFGYWNLNSVDGDNGSRGTLDDAITAGGFITFTVTPADGFSLNLNGGNVTFDYWVGDSNQSRDVALFTSIGGFTSAGDAVAVFDQASVGSVDVGTGDDGDGVYGGINSGVVLSFTGAQYDNITSPLEIRLYIADSNFNMAQLQRYSFFDNVQLNGAVVPEPSFYALGLGLIALGGVYLRRRRYQR